MIAPFHRRGLLVPLTQYRAAVLIGQMIGPLYAMRENDGSEVRVCVFIFAEVPPIEIQPLLDLTMISRLWGSQGQAGRLASTDSPKL